MPLNKATNKRTRSMVKILLSLNGIDVENNKCNNICKSHFAPGTGIIGNADSIIFSTIAIANRLAKQCHFS